MIQEKIINEKQKLKDLLINENGNQNEIEESVNTLSRLLYKRNNPIYEYRMHTTDRSVKIKDVDKFEGFCKKYKLKFRSYSTGISFWISGPRERPKKRFKSEEKLLAAQINDEFLKTLIEHFQEDQELIIEEFIDNNGIYKYIMWKIKSNGKCERAEIYDHMIRWETKVREVFEKYGKEYIIN